MQSTLCEMPGWMKHKLESRLLGEISITSDMQMTLPLWGCRGWGWQAAGTWVLVSVKWWDSPPPLADVEPANQYTPSKKPEGELKSQRAPKFEQKPAKFVPMGLLCKHVTNHFVTRM